MSSYIIKGLLFRIYWEKYNKLSGNQQLAVPGSIHLFQDNFYSAVAISSQFNNILKIRITSYRNFINCIKKYKIVSKSIKIFWKQQLQRCDFVSM